MESPGKHSKGELISMPDQIITCPHCHKEIPLSEAISHQFKEKLQKELEDQSKKKTLFAQ